MGAKVSPVPPGYRTVTPHLVVAGCADAIAFYAKAFGAEERFRMPGPNGKIMHAEIQLGDSVIMLADENPEMGCQSPKTLGGTPVAIQLYVENIDSLYDQAVAAGAAPLMPPADMFWGDRYARVADPFGHTWAIATHQRDLSPEEIQTAMAAAFQA